MMRVGRVNLSACIALVLAILALYGSGFDAPFLHEWDDSLFIVENPLLKPTGENVANLFLNPFDSIYIPIPMLSLALDRHLFGLNPIPFRIHAMILFCGCAVLLFLLMRELGANAVFAFAGAALWAFNPQKLESVAWLSERKDLVSGILVFASVLCFIRSVRRGRIPYAAGVLGILAVCSKPTAFPLPGALIVLGLLTTAGDDARKRIRLLAPPVLAISCAVAWAWFVTAKTTPFLLRESLLAPLHNLVWHPATALLPFNLNPAYPETILKEDLLSPAAVCAILVGGAVLLALRFGVRPSAIAAAGLIAVGALVPVLGFHAETPFAYCDRYNFLPSAAVLTPLVLLANRVWDGLPKNPARLAIPLCAAILCAWFAFRTTELLPFWRSDEALFLHAWRTTDGRRPANYKVYESLCGVALHGKDDRALLRRVADEMERFQDASEYKRLPNGMISNSVAAIRAHLAFDENADEADAASAVALLGPLRDHPELPVFRTLRGMLAVDAFNLAAIRGERTRMHRAMRDLANYYGPNATIVRRAHAVFAESERDSAATSFPDAPVESNPTRNAAPESNAAKEHAWKF